MTLIFAKRAAAVLAAVALCVAAPAVARADVDGAVPSPGNCPYPGVGPFGAAFGEYDFYCAFPTEINGSHWQVLFGGGMWQVTAGVQANIMMVSFNVGVIAPAGVLRGITYFACPDLSMADAPNPPGAWKNEIHPGKCKTIAPRPVLIRDGDEPQPPAGAPRPPVDAAQGVTGPGPAVTDPVQGNPDATVNQPR